MTEATVTSKPAAGMGVQARSEAAFTSTIAAIEELISRWDGIREITWTVGGHPAHSMYQDVPHDSLHEIANQVAALYEAGGWTVERYPNPINLKLS